MTKEEASLRVEMGKLVIEPEKLNRLNKYENPFVPLSQQRQRFVFKPCTQSPKCSCSVQKRNKNITLYKKKRNKILKEPVLILSQCLETNEMNKCKCNLVSHKFHSDNLGLNALVNNCNQLSISSETNNPKFTKTELNDKTKQWKRNVLSEEHCRENGLEKCHTGSCSQQALNPPCDVTIDELASYFETLVHIPKKMSSMAEMMYI